MKNIEQIAIFPAVALGVLLLTSGLAQAQDAATAAPAAVVQAPIPMSLPVLTPAAPDVSQPAATTVSNGPVPDTAANRARYGQPMSHAGKKTPPKGN